MEKHIKIIKEEGFEWEDGWLERKGKKICNFFPKVLACYINQKTGEIIYVIQIHIGGEAVKPFFIPASRLEKMDYTRISDKCTYGIEIPASEARRFILYFIKIQANGFSNPGILLGDIGWNELDNKDLVYCAGNRIIAKEGPLDAMVDEQLKSCFKILDREHGQDKRIFKVCRAFLCMGCPIVTILILTSVLACLKSMFVKTGAVPHFAIYIYGSTGTYKTTMAKYFCRLYGDKDGLGGLFVELESTNPALEETIGQARDACVVIDDIAPCQTNKNTKDKKEKAASLIRKAASGTPSHKCRGSQVLSINYDGVLVFTAEDLLETVSIMNRTILVCTDSCKIGNKILNMMNENPDFSVLFQQYIIEWAAMEQEDIMCKIKESFGKGRNENKASSKDGSWNRVRESFDILHIAWELLQMCGRYYEYELSGIDSAVSEAVTKAMDNEMEVLKGMEMKQTCNNLGELLFKSIDMGEIVIAENKKDFEKQLPFCVYNDMSGVRHKGKLYLMDEKIVDFLNQKYQMKLSKSEFRKKLEKDGLLVKDESGARTKKLSGMRLLVVDYEGLKGLYG